MQNKDFELSNLELDKLNHVIQKISRNYYASEGEPVNDVTVTFEFAAPLGRSVWVSVSGSVRVDLDDVTLDPSVSRGKDGRMRSKPCRAHATRGGFDQHVPVQKRSGVYSLGRKMLLAASDAGRNTP